MGEIKEISSVAYSRERRGREERERNKSAFLGGIKVTNNPISPLADASQRDKCYSLRNTFRVWGKPLSRHSAEKEKGGMVVIT